MFVRQLNARFASLFAGYRDSERGAFDSEKAARFIGDARRVRCKDYIYNLDIVNGAPVGENITTTPNWFFIMTNAAVYFDGLAGANSPLVRLRFPDNVVNSPFADILGVQGVPASLVFGREGGERFEEYKNLFYVMGDRINMRVDVTPAAATNCHGYLLLTGVEIDLLSEGL